jgi:hypothetical protein
MKAIGAAIERHWSTSESGDTEAEHAIYADGAILDYPQSGERFSGRARNSSLRVAVGPLERELLLVDLPAWHPSIRERAASRGRETGSSAEVNVASSDVRHEPAEVLPGHGVRRIGGRSDQIEELSSARNGDGFELVAKQEVGRGGCAVDERERPRYRERLEKRAHGGDPDSSGDQKYSVAGAPPFGHGTVRPLHQYARSGSERLKEAGAVAGLLHGEAKVAVCRRSGERERMRGDPIRSSQEPPAEELTRFCLQFIEMAASHADAHGARASYVDRFDAEPVPPCLQQRFEHAVSQQERETDGVHATPEKLDEWFPGEIRPG